MRDRILGAEALSQVRANTWRMMLLVPRGVEVGRAGSGRAPATQPPTSAAYPSRDQRSGARVPGEVTGPPAPTPPGGMVAGDTLSVWMTLC